MISKFNLAIETGLGFEIRKSFFELAVTFDRKDVSDAFDGGCNLFLGIRYGKVL